MAVGEVGDVVRVLEGVGVRVRVSVKVTIRVRVRVRVGVRIGVGVGSGLGLGRVRAVPARMRTGTRASARAIAACRATAPPSSSRNSARAWRPAGPRPAGRGNAPRLPASAAGPTRRGQTG